jgi:hypothetical protein
MEAGVPYHRLTGLEQRIARLEREKARLQRVGDALPNAPSVTTYHGSSRLEPPRLVPRLSEPYGTFSETFGYENGDARP